MLSISDLHPEGSRAGGTAMASHLSWKVTADTREAGRNSLQNIRKGGFTNNFFSEPLRATSSHEASFGWDVVSDSYPRGLMTRWQYIIPGWKNFQHWFVAIHLSAFRLFLLMDSSDQHIARWASFLMWSQGIYPLTFKDSKLGPQKRKGIKKLHTKGVLKSKYFWSKLYGCFPRFGM